MCSFLLMFPFSQDLLALLPPVRAEGILSVRVCRCLEVLAPGLYRQRHALLQCDSLLIT